MININWFGLLEGIELLSFCGLLPSNPYDRLVNVGTKKNRRREGHATTLLKHFSGPITTWVNPDNTAAIGLLEKVGYDRIRRIDRDEPKVVQYLWTPSRVGGKGRNTNVSDREAG